MWPNLLWRLPRRVATSIVHSCDRQAARPTPLCSSEGARVIAWMNRVAGTSNRALPQHDPPQWRLYAPDSIDRIELASNLSTNLKLVA